MAVIKLTEISSFEREFKSQAATNRINSLRLTHVYHCNKHIRVLVVSDQSKDSLLLFESDGIFYENVPSKNVDKIKSFQDLGIRTVNGNKDYQPELTWIDTSCDDRIYVVDTKFDAKNNTQHVVKYDHPMPNPKKKNLFTLDDVIIQIGNQKIHHFGACESRSYDSNYGGYPVFFYAINDKEDILEFDTTNYRNRIFANLQSLKWKVTHFNQKKGFVRLTENSYYWGHYEELIYAFGFKKDPEYFFLELINGNSLQTNSSSMNQVKVKKTPNEVKLDFGSCIDFKLKVLPEFDSATCLDDKEFLITMIPVINENLDTSCRDIYWFRLKNSKDEAVLLADPYRISSVDRFDNVRNYESPIWIRHTKDFPTLEDLLYVVTGQDTIKKFKLDLKP